jgi:peptidyl-prolyl cis-trans isomerase C
MRNSNFAFRGGRRYWRGPLVRGARDGPKDAGKDHVSFARVGAGIALFILLGGQASTAQDRAIATVNGKPITETDMTLAEAEIGSDLGSLPLTTKRRVLVEFLIENQLFADAAERQQLGSGAAFNERMPYWRRRALRDAYFDTTVRNSVNDAEARRHYESEMAGSKSEEEVRARHILVASKAKAREAFEKLAHGSDFARLAKQYSTDGDSKDRGGDLGFLARGQMVPQMEEVVFNLKRGEVSEPFQSQLGWHVARVEERRHRPAQSFDAVKERVVAALIHKKAQQIAGDLRGKAQIEYIDPEIRRSVESERAGARPRQ